MILACTSLMMCIACMAQWSKPEIPKATPMSVGTELYLFNPDAEAFFVGANEYGTRASFSQTSGHRVVLVASEDDAESFQLTNAADGSETFLPLYIKGVDAVWVDESGSNTGDDLFTLKAVEGGYLIALSALNAEFNPELYPETYLGVIPEKDDTRLYLTDPQTFTEDEGYKPDGFFITWYFVTAADYTAYTSAMKQYRAAVALGNMIETAKSTEALADGALEAAQKVYADSSSGKETLDEATAALKKAIDEANFKTASVENPFEVLQALGTVEQNFTNSRTTGWTSTTMAQNKQASNGNNAADYSVTGNHYENWHPSAFGIGRIYTTLADLPTGVYHLNALAFANVVGGTYLYAGDDKTLIGSTNIDTREETDVWTIVTDGTLEIGLRVEEQGPNWVGFDNVNLYYLGGSSDSYNHIANIIIDATTDYKDYIENNDETVYYSHATYDAYLEARTQLDAIMESGHSEEAYGNAMKQALADFTAAADALGASIDAYAAYAEMLGEADDWVGTMSNGSDQANLLADYLMEDSEPTEGVYNGNGGSQYIVENGSLDAEAVKAETAYLEQLLNDAVASGMSDGDDCTELLKNPNFSEQGGWTSAVGPVWPTGNTDVFPIVEASNMVCDVYQQLTGLQNGLYEMTLQAAFRPGAEYTDENESVKQAYAYINNYETKLPSGQLDDNSVALNDASEASQAFADGLYPLTVYGLVTDGTMRIGITNKVRSVESCRLWAGGVKLTFRAKNEEVLASVIAQTLPTAETMISNICGQPELNSLQAAIDGAKAPADAYDALISLKAAIETVDECTATYANLFTAINLLDEAIAAATNASAKTLAEAKEVLEAAQTDYNNRTYNNEEAVQAISDVNAAAVSVKMGGDQASEDNPVDYTSAIVNNNFDPSKGDKNTGKVEGWTTTAMNGYKQFTVSYNRAPFELYQKLSGLPKGNYKVTVHTYYRAGYYNEEETRIANGIETHLTTLYAETSTDKYTKPVMNLSEGATAEKLSGGNCYTLSNGLFAPDGTTPTADYFAAGAYLNTIEFTVPEDGKVRIGLSKTEVFANDYEVVGEWKLYYISGATNDETDPADVNGDGGVDTQDVLAIYGFMQDASGDKATFDVNHDGMVDTQDVLQVYSVMQANVKVRMNAIDASNQ